jgi:hypothetical protein
LHLVHGMRIGVSAASDQGRSGRPKSNVMANLLKQNNFRD